MKPMDMLSDPLWKYSQREEVFIFVEESIDEGTQWVVSSRERTRPPRPHVRRIVGNFLRQLWLNGALLDTKSL